MESVIRLLPFAVADGATNMAADETLLCSAAAGVGSLRFYGWTAATVSLGYFQPSAVRLADPLLAALPWVRRPSGGATLVHHHELTYAIALPPGSPWQTGQSWLPRMHRIITAALLELGVSKNVESVGGTPVRYGDILCFQQYTSGDLLCTGKKIVGSAQRKYHKALLQHGSILLAQSMHTPALPGIREMAGVEVSSVKLGGAIIFAFSKDTGLRVEVGNWTEQEKRLAEQLAAEKYATAAWNERR